MVGYYYPLLLQCSVACYAVGCYAGIDRGRRALAAVHSDCLLQYTVRLCLSAVMLDSCRHNLSLPLQDGILRLEPLDFPANFQTSTPAGANKGATRCANVASG